MLLRRTVFYILILFFTIQSCYQRPRDRAKNVIRYLADVHHIRPISNERHLVAIIENSFCGACNAEIIGFIREQLKEGKRITIVLQREDADMQSGFSKYGDVTILIDTQAELERYGLLFAKSQLYILNGNQLLSNFSITEKNFEKIKKAVNDTASI